LSLGVIFPTLKNLAVVYNNLENSNDRVALLSACCLLSNVNEFKKAGFIFGSNSDFDYAREKNKKNQFVPAYADEKVLKLREKQAFEKKEYLCCTLRWAFSSPSLFQLSNIPLLKKSVCLCSLNDLFILNLDKKKMHVILTETSFCFLLFS
jgi:hypothetical protein